jgi:hypothetical protein
MAPRYWLIGSYRHEKNRNRHIEPGTGDLILRFIQEADWLIWMCMNICLSTSHSDPKVTMSYAHLSGKHYGKRLTLLWLGLRVDWFNNHRLPEPIGNIPPAEFEMAYYHQLEESADAAWLKQKSLRKSRDDSFGIFCVHVRKVKSTSWNIIGLCVENSHFAYLLHCKWIAHATLHCWRSVGVATARADLKSFAARGMADQDRGKAFKSGRKPLPLRARGAKLLSYRLFGCQILRL